MGARQRWSELSEGKRRLIMAAGAAEAALKLAALVDLNRRPASEVRGPKALWAVAVVVLNSVGLAPLAYFRYGRQT